MPGKAGGKGRGKAVGKGAAATAAAAATADVVANDGQVTKATTDAATNTVAPPSSGTREAVADAGGWVDVVPVEFLLVFLTVIAVLWAVDELRED